MPRLFTALEISQDATLSLNLLRGGLPGARWIEPENYHITLRFFGDIDNIIADELVFAFDRIERKSFEIKLLGIEVFGSKKPHSLFARVAPCEELLLLQAEIDRIAKRLGLKFDKTKYVPHVTIARLRNVQHDDLLSYLSSRGNFSTMPFQINRFTLMSSRQSVGGGPYIIEESWYLSRSLS
ncbi:RNA 2',3'-cyclic phosphodiesterase [Bartonella tamiae]|uniref:RNA 2',3'-cyclic phosphodiesterase n=1 Tax=Bartonella tamiae Th239 TaxID=1094558 RepID=J1K1Z3_9HYPH|nr:RNA 2',3'-cyclic phosphodiesterase [Bartonella tamiae]EJF91105.1 2'-5' RNA ligase [Bartonella tamiae Th239]EJF93230.1 2'-5' RNA ligase [Bartonella tamiae Th307]